MTVRTEASAPWERVSVVIPALNEATNLPPVLASLPHNVHQVIVVDGHSVDGTLAVAKELRPDACILTQTRNGKGNALACGFAASTGDIIVMLDADGSADPTEIPRFVDALQAGADFAKGSRFAPGGGSSDLTRLRSAGNRMLSAAVNARYGTHYTDLCYGFNAFWRRHLPVLGLETTATPAVPGGMLWGDGFEVETLIHIRVAAAGLRVSEVASYEHARTHGSSNLNVFSDGIRVLRTILRNGAPAPGRHFAPPVTPAPAAEFVVTGGAGDDVVSLGASPAHAVARAAARPGGAGPRAPE